VEIAMTHRISKAHIVYSFDRTHPAVLEIDPGDTVVMETYDARTGTVRTEQDLLDRPHPKGANPATGPIFVRGAAPEDSLAVEILKVELADRGFIGAKVGQGVLGHRVAEYVTKIVPVRDGQILFSDTIRFPARPMVGVIGTAPAGAPVDTGRPGPHGGNMDNNDVRAGATVYLPVNVPGALFGLGDVHASMGDGEISITGIEICAEVTVRIHLIKGERVSRPWIETSDSWISTSDADDLRTAVRIACEEMAELLDRKLDLSLTDAFMLISARGDVRISQACEPSGIPVTARVVMPKM